MARRKAAPVTHTPEVNTGEMETEKLSPILLPNEGPIVREPEEIAVLDSPLQNEYADALAFNEDVLTIVLNESSEENAPQLVDVYCDGRAEWIRVGVPQKVKRKFVEILARAKPISVQTLHEDVGTKQIHNRIQRSTRAKYPLSVLHDPSPKGYEWLQRLMMER